MDVYSSKYHRGRLIAEDDSLSPLFQDIDRRNNKISWGKPAMFIQGKLDGRCPGCAAKLTGGLFQIGYDKEAECSWAYCHNCGYHY